METAYVLDIHAPNTPLSAGSAPLAKTTVAVEKPIASFADFHIPVQIQILDDTRGLIPAEIRRVNAGFIRLAVSVRVDANRSLEVLYAGRRLHCEVAYCNRQENKALEYHLGVQIIGGGGIRTEPRLPVDLPATMDYPGGQVSFAARVIDMSPSGLGLELPTFIPKGAMVSLDLGYGIAFGEIRHCAQNAGHLYRAGSSSRNLSAESAQMPRQQPRGVSSCRLSGSFQEFPGG